MSHDPGGQPQQPPSPTTTIKNCTTNNMHHTTSTTTITTISTSSTVMIMQYWLSVLSTLVYDPCHHGGGADGADSSSTTSNVSHHNLTPSTATTTTTTATSQICIARSSSPVEVVLSLISLILWTLMLVMICSTMILGYRFQNHSHGRDGSRRQKQRYRNDRLLRHFQQRMEYIRSRLIIITKVSILNDLFL